MIHDSRSPESPATSGPEGRVQSPSAMGTFRSLVRLALIFAVGSQAIAYVAYRVINHEHIEFRKTAVPVRATVKSVTPHTVTRHEKQTRKGHTSTRTVTSTRYRVELEYALGSKRVTSAIETRDPPPAPAGGLLEVLVDPANPSHAEAEANLETPSLPILQLAMGLMALFFFLPLSVMAVFGTALLKSPIGQKLMEAQLRELENRRAR